jgi:UDP-N-acetyl-D-glucosamine/UDP-N-acetyl-D-galactosamine dehydrogenase
MKIFPCVIGLGYVGLPIFLRLQRKFKTVGFDNNRSRILELNKTIDRNKEFKRKELLLKNKSVVTCSLEEIKNCNFYIVAVPTPIYKNNNPNISSLKLVSENLSSVLKKDDIVFYESTVYPGITEFLASKILSKKNKLRLGFDFYVGYSPERINPGDRIHTIEKISKIVSLDTNRKQIINKVYKVYTLLTKKIIFTKKIKEAETAKVIENTQRDLNIALMNEILVFCDKLKLDFHLVKKLAATKWNFLNFNPGLVGGHCLPVDPHYLSFIAKQHGLKLRTILAGRETNNYMSKYIISYLKNKLKKINKNIFNAKILLVGLTYKENVSDIRNSLALEIYRHLKKYNKKVIGIDYNVSDKDRIKYKIEKKFDKKKYDAVVFLVKNKKYENIYNKLKNGNSIIMDIFNFYK